MDCHVVDIHFNNMTNKTWLVVYIDKMVSEGMVSKIILLVG